MIGFNDMPMLDLMHPPLTTVHAPLKEMGADAASLLLRQLEDSDRHAYDIVLKPRLIERNSVRDLGA